MVLLVLTLVLGIAVGAVGACIALRPALIERRRRVKEVIELERELAQTHAELTVERSALDDRLASAIKTISEKALDSSSARFLELADARLAGYVRPLKDSLERMDRQIQGVERIRHEAYGSLRNQVATLSERTGSLANALRAPHVRGRWGEVQLKNVVEQAGMLEHCDYVRQATTTDDERTLRPDLVVRIPGGKHVVVDAKAPLVAYLDAFEATDDAERARHLADHARQVRDHVGKLSGKQYWRQFEPSPDFVVMFLPDESYLRAAHEHDAALAEDAWSANVILASPSTLVALLRTVAATWQQETVAESAREVHSLGRELYERIGKVGEHLAKLGRSLDGSVRSYNEAVGSLETRVLVTARKLEEHGIGGELESPAPVEHAARPLTAPELQERAPLAILAGDADAA
jgi:DNA recombination protein RmuC